MCVGCISINIQIAILEKFFTLGILPNILYELRTFASIFFDLHKLAAAFSVYTMKFMFRF